jgi:hypothetical protein
MDYSVMAESASGSEVNVFVQDVESEDNKQVSEQELQEKNGVPKNDPDLKSGRENEDGAHPTGAFERCEGDSINFS